MPSQPNCSQDFLIPCLPYLIFCSSLLNDFDVQVSKQNRLFELPKLSYQHQHRRTFSVIALTRSALLLGAVLANHTHLPPTNCRRVMVEFWVRLGARLLLMFAGYYYIPIRNKHNLQLAKVGRQARALGAERVTSAWRGVVGAQCIVLVWRKRLGFGVSIAGPSSRGSESVGGRVRGPLPGGPHTLSPAWVACCDYERPPHALDGCEPLQAQAQL